MSYCHCECDGVCVRGPPPEVRTPVVFARFRAIVKPVTYKASPNSRNLTTGVVKLLSVKKLISLCSLITASTLLIACSSDDTNVESAEQAGEPHFTAAPESADEKSDATEDNDDEHTEVEAAEEESEDSTDEGSPEPRTANIDIEDLKSLWVPELCYNEAGELVDGQLPDHLKDTPRANAYITWRTDGYPEGGLADINGDGRQEAVVNYYCDAGGVTWPSNLLIYDDELNFIAAVDPVEDMSFKGYTPMRAHMIHIAEEGDHFYLKWRGWAEDDGAAHASRVLEGKLTLNGTTPNIEYVTDYPNT